MPISRDLVNDEKDDAVEEALEDKQQVQLDPKVVVKLLLDELLDAAIAPSCEESSSLEARSGSMSFDEDDIEKRIKDIRRISESKSLGEQDDGKLRSNIGEGLAFSVDFEDRHWKRKESLVQKRQRRQSPRDFRNIDISPVQKCRKSSESRCTSPVLKKSGPSARRSPPLSASTPTLSHSIPWSVTDTAPQIFWSDTRIQKNSEENCDYHNQLLKSCVGSDPACEEEVSHEASTDVEEQLDLREILKRRRSKVSRVFNNESDQSIVGIDRIKVTVGKDVDIRKVVETDPDGGDESFTDEEIELEDGEISDRKDLVNYKEVNSKYNKNLMSSLLMKKKVLEHLIDMVNREENVDELIEDNDVFESTVGSMTSLTSGQLRDSSDFGAENLDTFEELSSRKVVYRSSSPFPSSLIVQSHPLRNISNDFNAEMEKGMMNLFPNQSKVSDDANVKVEPVMEEDDITLSDAETIISSGSGMEVKASRPSPSSQLAGVTGLGKLSCSLCNVTVATQRSLKQHWQGKKHQYNLGIARQGVRVDKKVAESVKSAATDVNEVNKPPRKRIIWDLK